MSVKKICICMQPSDHEALKQKASEAGQSLSEYLVHRGLGRKKQGFKNRIITKGNQ